MNGHRDLRLAGAAAALCAGLSLVLPLEPARLALAAPLTLFLPGYALTAATFARQRLEPPLFLTLSVSLSLIALVLGALLLHFLPGGLRAVTWALLLPLIVLAACRVAALRRPPPQAPRGRPLPRISKREGALLGGGLACTVAALALAAAILPAGEVRGYTQLWMLPVDGSRQATVQVGVTSQETQAIGYRLRIRVHRREDVEHRFRLAPGETRVVEVRARRPPPAGRPARAVAMLFRNDRPGTVYRRVSGWVSAPKAG